MTTTAPPALSALARGIAVQEAALRALGPLLASAREWHDVAGAELGAVLHADDETRGRASGLVTIAVEAHTDLFRLVLRTERRLAALRGLTTERPGGGHTRVTPPSWRRVMAASSSPGHPHSHRRLPA